MSPIKYDTMFDESDDDDGWTLGEPKRSIPIIDDVIQPINRGFRHIFTRDLTIHREDSVVLILQGFIVVSLIAFWIQVIDHGLPGRDPYLSADKIVLYSLGGLSVVFGGFIVDLFVKKKYFFELLAGVGALAMFLTGQIPFKAANLMGMLMLSATSFLSGIVFCTNILSKTTLLNRARTVSLIIFLMILFISPIIIAFHTIAGHQWMWVMVFGMTVALVLIKKKLPINLLIGQIKEDNVFSLKDFIRSVKKSNLLPYVYFLFLTSAALGFYMVVINEDYDVGRAVTIIIIVLLVSFPIIGALLDNVGRKPVVLLTMAAVGSLSIFFDYPAGDVYLSTIKDVQIGVYGFAGLMIIVLTIVIAGDNSSDFSRGRIMGVFLFATVGGVIIGTQLHFALFAEEVYELRDLVQISDWASFLIFLSVLLLAGAREPFNLDTPYWRDYLEKLYIVSDAGIGMYSFDFNDPMATGHDLNEDLVSGGLSGIQSMLKEISKSKSQIKVLDHGDMKLIFQYGKATMAVLFVRKNLVVYREKLARFHEMFEYRNEAVLKHFHGNISRLKDLEELKDTYFT